MWTKPKPLQVGERVRFEDGSRWRVEHVGPGSATVVPEYQEPRKVRLIGKDGKERTFEATSGGRALQISVYSIVERVS